MTAQSEETIEKIEAAVFRKLLSHLRQNTNVQNIELMITADFCRNCLSNWYADAAKSHGLEVSKDEARERVYGMPYAAWKDKYQTPATPEQLAAYDARRAKKNA
ncbi:MAG: DUF1244 domain-containing protein [Caulobacterales bacterium]|nr:DUF1244 domain-containing protein [Caulobacterales bacterium]